MTRSTPFSAKLVHADELTGADWFKSSYSGGEGDCIEVAGLRMSSLTAVAIRDSKNPTGPILALPTDAFSTFVTSVKSGDLGTV